METQGTLRSTPSRPIALAIAGLAVLALALTGWSVFGSAQTTSGSPASVQQAPRPNHLPLDCDSDPYSPHDPICTPYHDPFSPHDPVS